VQKRILSVAFTAILSSLIIVSCSKFDTTDIGSDLLPAVDNVNTFETLLTVNTTQGFFNTDSTLIGNSEDHILGKINNDPLFGKTTANIYAQFKPSFYPYYYGNAKDTIPLTGFDSVVLCLSYKGFWGDSTTPIQLQVREVLNNVGNNGLWDSVNQSKPIYYAPATGSILGSATVNIASLGNYIVYSNHKDSVKNQIRIKLSTAFANSLFAKDSVGTNTFRSDSLFRAFNNGFAIIANGIGNGLLYTNLTDSSSKLEIHYRHKNGSTIDTTFSTFKIALSSAAIATSATVNNIIRDRSSGTVSAPSTNEMYLQTNPSGTFVNLTIPQLDTLSNRIIHRAEVIVEQIPDNPLLDGYFTAPNFLYLDLKDTSILGIDKWKPIYFDLNPNVAYDPDLIVNSFFPTGGVDILYHGGYSRSKTDLFGNAIKYYNFNITRYVQQTVTKRTKNYTLRLFAPYQVVYAQYSPFAVTSPNALARGRVKVGGGNNANYKLRLRLVYSKI